MRYTGRENVRAGDRRDILNGCALVGLLIITGIVPSAISSSASSSSSNGGLSAVCIDKLDSAVVAGIGAEDFGAASTSASNSSLFKLLATGYSVAYSSTFQTWNFDKTNCQMSMTSIDVSFSAANSSGFVGHIVVEENPTTYSVYNATMQFGGESSDINTYNWSGMEFNNGQVLDNDYAYWNMPGVYVPDQGCSFTHCDVAFWVGLANQQLGANGIAQTGTDSGIYCIGLCQYFFYGWYQFLPAQSTQQKCTITVNPGDQVFAQVYANPSGSTAYYTVFIDTTRSQSCTSNYNLSSMGASYFDQFIGERPCLSNCGTPSATYTRLPKFDTTTFTNGYVASNPMFNYPYYQDDMVNGGVLNIQNTYVSSTSFSETWLSSANT